MTRAPSPRTRPVALAVASLAALTTAAIAGWLLFPSPFGRALLALAFSWAGGTALLIPTFLAASLDDIPDVLAAAFLSGAAAMWFAPALLLLRAPKSPLQIAGLALIAGAAVTMAAQRAPHRYHEQRRRRTAPPMFGQPIRMGGFSLPVFVVVAAIVALQIGIWFAWTASRLRAAALIALAAATLTRSWIWRGAARPPGDPLSAPRILFLALTLLLTLILTHESMRPDPPGESPGGIVADTANLFRELSQPAPRPAAPQSTTQVFSAKEVAEQLKVSGSPGLILRPKNWQRAAPITSPPPSGGGSRFGPPGAPLEIPFTGEYHLYRTGSGRLPEYAPVETGTPLDGVWGASLGVDTMETEAHQPLRTPLDLARCREIRLTIRSGEIFRASATLNVLTNHVEQSLGTQYFGLDPIAEETLVYSVPSSLHAPATEFIVRFGNTASDNTKSTRVAVLRFAVAPR